MPKRKKKPYFNNHAAAIMAAPDEAFRDPSGDQLTFEDFMKWRVHSIELPPTVLCIIKEHKPNGKVKEHVYQRGYAANRKIKQLIINEQEFTVVDREGCEQIYPSFPIYDDPLA